MVLVVVVVVVLVPAAAAVAVDVALLDGIVGVVVVRNVCTTLLSSSGY